MSFTDYMENAVLDHLFGGKFSPVDFENPNLVVNGNFSSWTATDPDNWTTTEAGSSLVSERGFDQGSSGSGTGSCNITQVGIDIADIEQNITTVIGEEYELHVDIGYVNSGILDVTAGPENDTFGAVGHFTLRFVATSTSTPITISVTGPGEVTFDNVAVYLVPRSSIPTLYIGLSSTSPTDAGVGSFTEPTAASYARAAVVANNTNFPAAVGGSIKNAIAISFPKVLEDWGATLSYFGIFDAAIGGSLIAYGALTTPVSVAINQVLTIPVDELVINLT